MKSRLEIYSLKGKSRQMNEAITGINAACNLLDDVIENGGAHDRVSDIRDMLKATIEKTDEEIEALFK